MVRYESQERVWKNFKDWESVKDYMDKVEKVIAINGVKKISIEFINYNVASLDKWRISVDLEKM